MKNIKQELIEAAIENIVECDLHPMEYSRRQCAEDIVSTTIKAAAESLRIFKLHNITPDGEKEKGWNQAIDELNKKLDNL